MSKIESRSFSRAFKLEVVRRMDPREAVAWSLALLRALCRRGVGFGLKASHWSTLGDAR